jgi:hypothetical protein
LFFRASKILFLADNTSVHASDTRNGLVQDNVIVGTGGGMLMCELWVYENTYLIVRLSKASKNMGLLVFHLEHPSRPQFLPGNYSSISLATHPSRSVLALRIDEDDGTRRTRCFVDVMEFSDSGTLSRIKTVPLASSTTNVLAAVENLFFA